MKTVLVALGVLAALVASGSATVEQAQAAGMKGPVPIALVVLLEVVNVAGTWTWMTDPRTRVQVEAAAGVGVASVVTGICGVLSYGPLGLVPAVGVLFTVHLVGRLQHRPDPSSVVTGAPAPSASPVQGTDLHHPQGGPAPTFETWATSPEPIPAPVPPPGDDEESDEAKDARIGAWIAAQAVARGRPPGRDAIRAEHGVGAKRAQRLLDEHNARPRLALAGES